MRALLLLAGLMLAASPAAAHEKLKPSSPIDGAQIPGSLRDLRLTFLEAPEQTFTRIRLLDSNHQEISGPPTPGTRNPSSPFPGGPPLRARVDTTLTLQEATARALVSNLELRVSRADTGFAQAELVGSRLRPNPSLAMEYVSTGDGRVSLTQDLQLWGVRGYRIRVATLGQQRARYSALDAARLVRRDVTRTYRELLFQQERAGLLDSLARVNERIARVARAAFEQGLGSEIDSRLSYTTYQQSLLDRDAALREAAVQQVELARLLGDSLTARYRLTDSLPVSGLHFLTAVYTDSASARPVRFTPDEARVDSLLQVALAARPDVQAARVDLEAQQASLAAARAAGKPTVAVGAIYSRAQDGVGTVNGREVSIGENGLGLGVVIGLPVRNRNQGEVVRAQFAGEAAALRLASVRQTLERDIRVAVGRVAIASSRVETLRRVILPSSQGALRVAEIAFGRGQVNIFEVLQVQRIYNESTTALLDSMRELATGLADLEAAVGGPVQ
ncbi:MAG: TolC family protein [Gemmatimonadota bacterium]